MPRVIIALLLAFGLVVPITPRPASTAEEEYRDPADRFSVPVPANWSAEEVDVFVLLRAPDGDLSIAALVVESADAGAGVIAAWQLVDPAFDPAAREPDRVEIPSDPGVDQTVVLTYDLGQTSGHLDQGLGQRVGDQVYVLIFRGDLETAVRRQSQINVIITGFRILAVTQTDLTGRVPLPLEGDRLRTFEDFVAGTLADFGVPGAAVAVVYGGEIVYAQGFGVTAQGDDRAVTPDTLMMIGSVTKSFTTMLIGTLVDDGPPRLGPASGRDLAHVQGGRPGDHSEGDRAQSGLRLHRRAPPRRRDRLQRRRARAAEDVIASLADFPFYTPIGEAFQYSNQMVAAGGYIAALAAGGRVGDLHAAYLAEMQQRVLDPIGMTRTTFDSAAVAADPDHALPHGATLDGAYQIMPLAIESRERPIAPASGIWSSANELARYVMTELRHGVGPAGNRVITAENLEETWRPQVAVSANVSYGLGWYVEQWQGLQAIRHGGNTRGFTSDLAVLPDADLGIVVLTNAQEANVVATSIRQRLLEILYDQPAEIERLIASVLDEARQQRAQTAAQLGDPIDPSLARTLSGDYRNSALGPVTVTYADGGLVADAGEFRVALRPLRTSPPDGPAFVVADPPFIGRPVRFDTTGPTPRLIFGAPPEEYAFDRITAAGHAVVTQFQSRNGNTSEGGFAMHRHLLRFSALVVLLAGPLAARGLSLPADAQGMSPSEHPLVGAWVLDLDVQSGDDPPLYLLFHADGTWILANPYFGEGVGAWQPTGERTAEATIVFQDLNSDPNAVEPGTLTAIFAIEVDTTGDAFAARWAAESRWLDGTLASRDDGTAKGTRLTGRAASRNGHTRCRGRSRISGPARTPDVRTRQRRHALPGCPRYEVRAGTGGLLALGAGDRYRRGCPHRARPLPGRPLPERVLRQRGVSNPAGGRSVADASCPPGLRRRRPGLPRRYRPRRRSCAASARPWRSWPSPDTPALTRRGSRSSATPTAVSQPSSTPRPPRPQDCRSRRPCSWPRRARAPRIARTCPPARCCRRD